MFLSVEKVFKDLKELSKFLKVFLSFFLILNITFCFLNLNGIKTGHFWSYEDWSRNTTFVNIGRICANISAIVGAISCVCILSRKISAFFWTTLFAIFYTIFVISQHLYGDMQVGIFCYFLLNICGWINWKLTYKKGTHQINAVKNPNLKMWIFFILLDLILCLLFFYEIPLIYDILNGKNSYPFKNNHYLVIHIFDSIILANSFVAYIMYGLRLKGIYYIWITSAVLRFLLFCGLFEGVEMNINQLIYWFMWIIANILMFFQWNEIFFKKKQIAL